MSIRPVPPMLSLEPLESRVLLSVTNLYVDPINGSDGANGLSQVAAFKTLERAQAEVRALNDTMTADLVVNLMDGIYTFGSDADRLIFTPEDSGYVTASGDEYWVRWQAADGATPIFDGGLTLPTTWTPVAGEDYYALSGVSGLDTARALWVDGVRADRAVYDGFLDGFDGLAGYSTGHTTTDGRTVNGYVVEDAALASWLQTAAPEDLARVEIQVIGGLGHQDIRDLLLDLDPASDRYHETLDNGSLLVRTVHMAEGEADVFQWKNLLRTNTGGPITFNTLPSLDQPGEFYYQAATDTVYYQPRAEEDLSTAEVIAPIFDSEFIRFQGSGDRNENLADQVHRISIEGITFRHNGWDAVQDQVGISVTTSGIQNYAVLPGAIYINRAHNLTVDNNRFEYLSTGGVTVFSIPRLYQDGSATSGNIATRNSSGNDWFHLTGSWALDFTNNEFRDLGGGGVLLSDAGGDKDRHSLDPSSEFYAPNEDVAPDGTSFAQFDYLYDIDITNNLITDYGNDIFNAVGVGAGYTADIRITHNTITDGQHGGISLGWGFTNEPTIQQNNHIDYNYISNVFQTGDDGGAIYVKSRNDSSTVRGNYITDVKISDRVQSYTYSQAPWALIGVYIDQGGSYWEVSGNVIDMDANGSSEEPRWMDLWYPGFRDADGRAYDQPYVDPFGNNRNPKNLQWNNTIYNNVTTVSSVKTGPENDLNWSQPLPDSIANGLTLADSGLNSVVPAEYRFGPDQDPNTAGTQRGSNRVIDPPELATDGQARAILANAGVKTESLSVTGDQNGVTLTWTTTPWASGYQVQRSTDHGDWEGIGFSPTGSWTDESPAAGQLNRYRVVAQTREGLGLATDVQSIDLTAVTPEPVVGTELITNGDFDNGITGWSRQQRNGTLADLLPPADVLTDAELLHDITQVTTGGNNTWHYRTSQSVDLIGGDTYQLSYDGRTDGDRNGKKIEVSLQTSGGPVEIWRDSLTADTQTFTHTFTADQNRTIPLRFSTGGVESRVWIDSVRMVNLSTGENVVTNGEFDNGTTGWSTSTRPGTIGTTSVVDSTDGQLTELGLEVTAAAGSAWWGRLSATPISMKANHTYEISFKARANAGRTLKGEFALQSGSVFLLERPTFTAKTQEYSYTYKQGNFDRNTVNVYFQVGNEASTVWIDDVSIRETPSPLDLSQSTVSSYGGSGQDQATATFSDAGHTVTLQGNGWKRLQIGYTVTADTILEFDYRSISEGEVQGIGFDNDNYISSMDSSHAFQVYGTQNWGLQNAAIGTYTGNGTYQTFTIRVGDYFTGVFNWLTLMNDDDSSGAQPNSSFSNIRLYEA